MPVYSRRSLRQSLGRDWLRDTLIGTITGSMGGALSLHIIDPSKADATASGEDLYQRQWLRLLATGGVIGDARVASFNVGSGAFLAHAPHITALTNGTAYELHALLEPAEKDRLLDRAIRDVRMRQEVAIWAIDQGRVYSLGPDVLDIYDARYFSDPSDSLNLGEHGLDWWKFEVTGSGRQLRISPALIASYQLVLDALLAVSLGSVDVATVNLPSDEWVLAGAAARGYWLLEQRTPAQAEHYRQRRLEAGAAYTRLSARFQPPVSRRVLLDEEW